MSAMLGVAVWAHAGAMAAEPTPRPGSAYVAMGSSFAAGPGITGPAPEGPVRCRQSQDSYPRQLARLRGLGLIDSSCSGATTEHILRGGQDGLPPQLDALTPDTRLVTVTIGGNDIRYMADLSVQACRNAPERRFPAGNGVCPAPVTFDLEAAFATLAVNMAQVASEVRRRAPAARLIFVDYLTVLPDAEPCAAAPLTRAQLAQMQDRVTRLAELTARIATEAGAEVLKASELTRGHDACAADPWVEGLVAQSSTPGLASFHPNLSGMTAIARALDSMLGR